MSISSSIEHKLTQSLNPEHLEIINESHRHAGPAAESHFKVVAVSERFATQSRIQRHRQVNALLAEELQTSVHALSLQLFTPSEWQAREGAVAKSPPCMGGSKHT